MMKGTGAVYAAAGVLYGLQCVLVWIDLAGVFSLGKLGMLAAGVMPTVLFVIFMIWVIVRDGKNLNQKGVAARAMGAAFGGAGLANLVLALIFGVTAFKRNDFGLWLFFPVTVCALQGAVWYAIAIIRRRWWMGGVAAGWFAIATGLFARTPADFNLFLGFGCFAFMAAPGYALMRIGASGK